MQRLTDFDGYEWIRADTYYGEIIKMGWVVAQREYDARADCGEAVPQDGDVLRRHAWDVCGEVLLASLGAGRAQGHGHP